MNEQTRPGWGLRLWAVLVGLVLVAPTLIVIPLSLTSQRSFRFPPRGWSLRWYDNIWSDPAWRDALLASLRIAVLVTVVATIVGTAAALGLHRTNSRIARLSTGVLLAPMIVPGIVAAVAIYSVFLHWGLTGTVTGFVLAHVGLAIPFVVVAVTASLRGTDPAQGRAAASLGASPLQTFWLVTLPAIRPGVASGALFAFVTSFDEVVAATFLQSPQIRTLPVQMFVSVTNQVDPTIAAVATLVTLVTTVLVVIPLTLRMRHEERPGTA
jgi:putative spermidine/putrescine transport system permease protein